MSKTAKWILGIIAVLAVLGVIAVGAFLVFRGGFGGFRPMMLGRNGAPGFMPPFRQDGPHGFNFPGRNFGPGFRRPGFFGIPFFMPIIPLLGLLVIVAIVLGIIWAARGRQPALKPAAVEQPLPQVAASAAAPASAACPQCQRPTQPDWMHCPYCGHTFQHGSEQGQVPPAI